MPRNFARHEQLLRIFALLETLTAARGPLEDTVIIDLLKDRLGLRQLSVRTLHRDCEFLISCGYPVDHVPAPGGRRQGWQLDKHALAQRRIPSEPLTLLELVAFTVGRELLRPLEGTVLWTGIEALRGKLEQSLTPALRERLAETRHVFHVKATCPSQYAARPRLISTLSKAIAERREIDVTVKADAGGGQSRRLVPLRVVIHPPRVKLLALEGQPSAGPPVLVDLERVETVTARDTTFEPPTFDVAGMVDRAETLS